MSASSHWRTLGLLVIAALPGCASQPGIVTPAARADRVLVESQHGDYQITSTAEGAEFRTTLQADPAALWKALPTVYNELKISISSIDPVHRLVEGSATARRSFANTRLSQFVECGSSVVGPNANSYNVRLNLQTQIDSTADRAAVVRTLMRSTAASDGGINVQCSSSGDLERLIVTRLRVILAADQPTR